MPNLPGMYLGDGHLVRCSHTYVLRVFLNEKQADVIQRVMAAISVLLPHNRVGVGVRRGTAVAIVTSYSRTWPVLLPQHGPGRKSTRRAVAAKHRDPSSRRVLAGPH